MKTIDDLLEAIMKLPVYEWEPSVRYVITAVGTDRVLSTGSVDPTKPFRIPTDGGVGGYVNISIRGEKYITFRLEDQFITPEGNFTINLPIALKKDLTYENDR